MESFTFPAAILGAIITALVYAWGRFLHREELETGEEPRGFLLFYFTVIGSGALIFVLGQMGLVFFYYLTCILTGNLLGFGIVHFVSVGLHLRQEGR